MPPAPTHSRVSNGRKPRVLCVDDEEHVLESLRGTLRRKYEIVGSTNGFEALRLLVADPFEVVLADMRMPLLNGARFLSLARRHAPDTVRVMLTGHFALPEAAAAVNEGEIFRVLIKPCKTAELTATLETAVAHHHARILDREALERSEQASARALVDIAYELDPDGASRADHVLHHATELIDKARGTPPGPVLERACELMQLGAVSISPETRARAAVGTRLGPEHAAELETLPALTVPLVPAVPALQPIRDLLAVAALPYAASRTASTVGDEAQILRIALDFELQLRQDAPVHAAVRTLQARSGRYDTQLLNAFCDLMQLT